MNMNNAQPAHLAQHGQQRPAARQTLRTITGLALLALAVFVTLSGRGCLC